MWFRHAKSGELAEHTNRVHLLAGEEIVDDGAVLPRAAGWPGERARRPSLDLLARAPATLGAGRLVCIDGPAGSGKTTLAAAVAEGRDGDAPVRAHGRPVRRLVGPPPVDEQLDGLLTPLGEGRAGQLPPLRLAGRRVRRDGAPCDPVPLLVLEGVGSGAGPVRSPADGAGLGRGAVRRCGCARGLERDGDAFAPHWEQWAADERDLFARERTRERADLVVDGTRPD